MKLVKLCVFSSFLFCSILVNATPLGSLQAIMGSPFATGRSPLSPAYSPVVAGNLFAAVSNDGDNTVSVFIVNQTTGTYTEVSGSPFATGQTPTGVAFSPAVSGNLFFSVSNFGDNTVSVYTVNTSTGALTQVSGSPFAAGNSPTYVAFSPLISGTGLFAAVSNGLDDSVSVYTVNTTSGAFTPVSGSPFATGGSPYYLAFSPVVSGNLFAAVTNLADDTVSVFKVNTSNGVFSQVYKSPFSTGSQPTGVAFSPAVPGGLIAAISNQSSNSVSVYKVNTTTGLFTKVIGAPYATGSSPTDVAFSPLISGNLFAAVPNNADNTVSVYKVNTTSGAFSQVSTSPFATGNSPYDLAFSPLVSGNLFVHISNLGDNTLSAFQVNLTP